MNFLDKDILGRRIEAIIQYALRWCDADTLENNFANAPAFLRIFLDYKSAQQCLDGLRGWDYPEFWTSYGLFLNLIGHVKLFCNTLKEQEDGTLYRDLNT